MLHDYRRETFHLFHEGKNAEVLVGGVGLGGWEEVSHVVSMH